MSFIKAFLENGRSRGEYLEHMEGVQTVALETFAIDANEIVEIFNRILCDDVGFSLSVQAVENFKTGLVLSIPQAQGDVKSIYIDIGYVPQSQDYKVNERGSDQVSTCQEFEMQLAVAEIIFKNLPDEQYIKFYRSLQNAMPEEKGQNIQQLSSEVISIAHVEMVPTTTQAYSEEVEDGQFVSIDTFTEKSENSQALERTATITQFPNSGTHQFQDVSSFARVEEDEDEDDIWGDDDDEGSHDSVSKHLSTDVNMR